MTSITTEREPVMTVRILPVMIVKILKRIVITITAIQAYRWTLFRGKKRNILPNITSKATFPMIQNVLSSI